ncbi:MAG: amidohydrolase family protein, partial [Pseudomonadota bacterium]
MRNHLHNASRYLFYFILAFSVTNHALAEQTGHIYGIYDRTNYKIGLTNATVVTEPGALIQDATIVIENGIIVSVEQNGEAPKDATIIDLTDHWVYAGFIDPYSDYVYGETKSYPSWGDPPKYEGDRTGGNAWNDAIHANIKWVDSFKADSEKAEPMIKNGYTTVQAGRMDGIFRGRAVTVSLADDIPNNLVYQANARHFASFNKGSSKQSYPSSLMGSIALIRQTLSDANWYQEAEGKIDTLFTAKPVEYNAALASLAVLSDSGVVFDAEDSLSTLRAHKLFDAYDIDAVFVGDGLEYARLAQVKATDATFILPFNYPKTPALGSFEAQLDTSLAELRHVERAPGNPAAMESAGISFAFTQYGLKDKKEFWTALATSIEHGLSETAALAALTTVPAKIAGVENISGKVASGYRADLVIADGNLFDGGKIKKVYLQGKGKEFEEISPFRFEGNFDVNIENADYRLTLEKDKDKLTGFMVAMQDIETDDPEKKFSISNVKTLDDQISFSVELPENATTMVYSFTGRLSDDQIDGYWLRPNLTRSKARLVKSSDQVDEEAPTDEKISSEVTYLSELTYPNRAFGLSVAPEQQNLHIKNATVWTSEDAG